MTEEWPRPQDEGDRADRFSYPEDEEGVVYLDDDGNEISPEEFRERVRLKAERLRREGEGTAPGDV
jgi:hypothetical protein